METLNLAAFTVWEVLHYFKLCCRLCQFIYLPIISLNRFRARLQEVLI